MSESKQEPSEAEKLIQLFLQKFAPNATDHKGAAYMLAREIEAIVRPVIDKADQRARIAEEEQREVREELEGCSQLNSDLEKDIENIETEKEWTQLVNQFWYYCGRY